MSDALTANEWIVMNALWARSPMTLSETIREIGDKAQWNYKTFSSYMAILERKGFIGAEKRGRDKFYYPLMSKEDCIALESRNVLNKIETGSVKLLMANMVRDSALSTSERGELLTMMESLLGEEAEQ